LADTKGRVAIQIRDLDQTVIGNPAHDLIRLGLSLASAARGSNLPGVTTARILEQLVSGYEKALSDDIERGKDKIYRPKRIQVLLEQSVRRRWRQLALERLESVKPVFPVGKKFWALPPEERTALVQLSSSSLQAISASATFSVLRRCRRLRHTSGTNGSIRAMPSSGLPAPTSAGPIQVRCRRRFL
jgi:uncharacterized protein (DUF2252 family)